MRVLVCGGRTFDDRPMLLRVMDRIHATREITTIIHGAQRGADLLAGAWAVMRRVPVQEFPADWNAHREAAGPIRNQRMLDESKPDLVVGFPGGGGTSDMLTRAARAGVMRYELPTRFILEAGSVGSLFDAQRHLIPAGRLAYLYGVALNRTVTASATAALGRVSWPANWPANWPVLVPRSDGNYTPAKGIEDP